MEKDLNPSGIDGLFKPADANQIVAIINSFTENAAPAQTAATAA